MVACTFQKYLLIDNNTFLHKKTLCVEFDKEKNLEIDDKEDFNIIKKFL